MKIKLSTWAKQNGITYKTAHLWIQKNKFPKKFERTPTGSIFVYVDDPAATDATKPVYTYARVSTHAKKDDLIRQQQRCADFCAAQGLAVTQMFKEVGSGMNDMRTQLTKLLDKPKGIIVVENKDRLTRFGFNYLDKLYSQAGGQIIVINGSQTQEDDLMKDLVSVITSFCCRLYGMRRGYHKARLMRVQIEEEMAC